MKTKLLFILGLISIFATSSFTEKELRPSIERIVEKLKKENRVHFGYSVGFAGEPETNNKYYKLYQKLKSKATNDELILLTKDQFKPVVIYAFEILHSRSYENLKEIFIDHIKDTTFYWTAGGCTGFVDRINWFMLKRLNPGNTMNKNLYLTKNEYEKYCQEFSATDTLFRCE